MPLPGLMREGQVKPEWGAQIDLDLEICQGLMGAWTFADFPITDGPASTYDSLGYLTGTYNVTGAKTKPGQAGVAMFLPGNNTGVITLPLNSKTNLSTDLTIATRFQWQGGTPNFNPMFSKWDTGGVHGYGLSLNPSFKLRGDSYNSTGSTITGSTTLSANTWYDAVFSLSSVTEQLFLNGISDATPISSPIMPGTGGTSPLALIGGDNGNTGAGDQRGWNGLLEYVYLFNRAFSQEEAAIIHSAPYSIYKPTPVRIFYSVAASNVTAALTGLALVAARGSVTPGTDTALSGLSCSASRGSISAALTATLLGQGLTVGQGSLFLPSAVPTVVTFSGGGRQGVTFRGGGRNSTFRSGGRNSGFGGGGGRA